MSTIHQRGATRGSLGFIAVLVVAIVVALCPAVPSQAAPPKPGGLAGGSSAGTVVLRWKPVRGASSYDVQMATSAGFDRLLTSFSTVNTAATPLVAVPSGRIHWRVRARRARGVSAWSTQSFSRAQDVGPALVSPPDGDTLSQPEEPPVLVWQAVNAARGYLIEVDNVGGPADQPDWVDSVVIETATTSTVVNQPQPNGHYHWRVRAELADGQYSRPSSSRRYSVGPLPRVSLDQAAEVTEQVVLTWAPVEGAVSYQLRVSTDNGFNRVIDQRTVAGTRYSPTVTYDNASYWWQVRPVNALGQSEEWPEFPVRTGVFRRVWQQNPAATTSTGLSEVVKPELMHPAEASNEGTTPGADLYFRWSPVRLASHYTLDLSRDPGFPNTTAFPTQSCTTTQTTYSSRRLSSASSPRAINCQPSAPGTWYWRVRALDLHPDAPSSGGVFSAFSAVRRFNWTPPTASSGTGTGQAGGTQLQLQGGEQPCTVSLPSSLSEPIGADDVCQGVSMTPTFDWEPVAGAAYYRIYLARDREFTNMVEGYGNAGVPSTLPTTASTGWTPQTALPDTQAGEAYYWYVRACNNAGSCGPNPDTASNAFQKKSEAVSLVPLASAADQVTFSWLDYLETNTAASYIPGSGASPQHPTQAAMAYRIQVSTSTLFEGDDIIDSRVVDQTTYTAFDQAYPEGPLWWRVQAIDGSENRLTWSDVSSFTKRSAAPLLRGPADGAVVNGVAPFSWAPRTYSALYDLQVFRNEDRTASPGNLAGSATNLRQTAYSFVKPLQALGTAFVWRVRRSDYSGNKGAWSEWRSFRVSGAAPTLVAPANNAVVPARGALFSWRPVPGAAHYGLQYLIGGEVLSVNVPQTAYATRNSLAKGAWKWRVISYDAQDDPVRASAWRSFRVR